MTKIFAFSIALFLASCGSTVNESAETLAAARVDKLVSCKSKTGGETLSLTVTKGPTKDTALIEGISMDKNRIKFVAKSGNEQGIAGAVVATFNGQGTLNLHQMGNPNNPNTMTSLRIRRTSVPGGTNSIKLIAPSADAFFTEHTNCTISNLATAKSYLGKAFQSAN
jgi:hypothetical protein